MAVQADPRGDRRCTHGCEPRPVVSRSITSADPLEDKEADHGHDGRTSQLSPAERAAVLSGTLRRTQLLPLSDTGLTRRARCSETVGSPAAGEVSARGTGHAASGEGAPVLRDVEAAVKIVVID